MVRDVDDEVLRVDRVDDRVVVDFGDDQRSLTLSQARALRSGLDLILSGRRKGVKCDPVNHNKRYAVEEFGPQFGKKKDDMT